MSCEFNQLVLSDKRNLDTWKRILDQTVIVLSMSSSIGPVAIVAAYFD